MSAGSYPRATLSLPQRVAEPAGDDRVEFSCVSWATRGASNRWSEIRSCAHRSAGESTGRSTGRSTGASIGADAALRRLSAFRQLSASKSTGPPVHWLELLVPWQNSTRAFRVISCPRWPRRRCILSCILLCILCAYFFYTHGSIIRLQRCYSPSCILAYFAYFCFTR